MINKIVLSGIGFPVNNNCVTIAELACLEKVQLLSCVEKDRTIFSLLVLPSSVRQLWLHGDRTAAAVPVITAMFKHPSFCFQQKKQTFPQGSQKSSASTSFVIVASYIHPRIMAAFISPGAEHIAVPDSVRQEKQKMDFRQEVHTVLSETVTNRVLSTPILYIPVQSLHCQHSSWSQLGDFC